MPIKIALIISVLLQCSAAVIAVTLIKRTRTNIAWWLISAGFLLMAIRRVMELVQFFNNVTNDSSTLLRSWIGVLISVFILLSLVFIKRIFNIQNQIDGLRKENEAKILTAIIKTEENERQRFAKELHDGLGPLLSSIKMAFSALTRNAPLEKDINLVNNTNKLIDESIVTIKEISNNLSPHVLNNFGLARAIEHFVSNVNIPDSPNISFSHNLNHPNLPKNTEIVIYRVICELVNNSIKHAHAKNITIDLVDDNHTLTMEYFDNGIGLNVEEIEDNRGMGFSNIFSRVKSINGNITISAEPGKGFYTTLIIKKTP